MFKGIYLTSEQERLRREKISKTMLAKKIKRSAETRRKMSLNNNRPGLGRFAEQSNSWKGDKVGYRAIHYWVISRLGTPDICEQCGKMGLSGRHIQWANLSGKYKRELGDWKRLCASCHRKSHVTDELRKKLSLGHLHRKLNI